MSARRISLLQGMAVFGAVSAETLEFLLEQATEVTVRRGECFFAEGDPGAEMYVLEGGRVELLKHWSGEERWLAELGPGDCLGEMALMDLEPRSATARAIDECQALRIPRAALYDLYDRDVEQFVLIQMNMGREVSRRLRAADERIFRASLGENLATSREPGYLT